jgi:zinc protease
MQINSDIQAPNLYMTWNVKSLSTAKNPQDAYALHVLRSILDSGISSRLQNRLVREQKILTSVSVSYDLYSRGDTLFSMTALPAAGISFAQAEQALQKEIETLQHEFVTHAEIERISQRLVANLVYSQDDITNRAKNIGSLAVNGLDFRLSEQLPKKLAAVTPQDIQRVAREYFIRDNLSVLHLTPKDQMKN